MEGDKIMIENKQVMVIHFGGGWEAADKMNYKIRFQPEVVTFIDRILK